MCACQHMRQDAKMPRHTRSRNQCGGGVVVVDQHERARHCGDWLTPASMPFTNSINGMAVTSVGTTEWSILSMACTPIHAHGPGPRTYGSLQFTDVVFRDAHAKPPSPPPPPHHHHNNHPNTRHHWRRRRRHTTGSTRQSNLPFTTQTPHDRTALNDATWLARS